MIGPVRVMPVFSFHFHKNSNSPSEYYTQSAVLDPINRQVTAYNRQSVSQSVPPMFTSYSTLYRKEEHMCLIKADEFWALFSSPKCGAGTKEKAASLTPVVFVCVRPARHTTRCLPAVRWRRRVRRWPPRAAFLRRNQTPVRALVHAHVTVDEEAGSDKLTCRKHPARRCCWDYGDACFGAL